MDIEKINELMISVMLDHSPAKPEPAIQKIAEALMLMAQGLAQIKRTVDRLPDA